MKPTALLLLVLALVGCNPAPIPPVPPPNSDAADADDDGYDSAHPKVPATCQTAYAHFIGELHCGGDAGTTNWVDVCDNATKHAIDFHLACLVKAKDCAAVTVCLTK